MLRILDNRVLKMPDANPLLTGQAPETGLSLNPAERMKTVKDDSSG
jgi:hypothetical protein